jgi:hypothetical protein
LCLRDIPEKEDRHLYPEWAAVYRITKGTNCEGCSNETRSGIVLGEGVKVAENCPHRHPIDALADG